MYIFYMPRHFANVEDKSQLRYAESHQFWDAYFPPHFKFSEIGSSFIFGINGSVFSFLVQCKIVVHHLKTNHDLNLMA